ncbi:hypothetical protein B0I37DRAFT_189759 [Chaetomium sp. MPI-CAGE-AT-0009]|nr:hypothetical protein B0I37DRAFT_189759 [Chaetomium sp. MPI-CAGE-AT-0009]
MASRIPVALVELDVDIAGGIKQRIDEDFDGTSSPASTGNLFSPPSSASAPPIVSQRTAPAAYTKGTTTVVQVCSGPDPDTAVGNLLQTCVEGNLQGPGERLFGLGSNSGINERYRKKPRAVIISPYLTSPHRYVVLAQMDANNIPVVETKPASNGHDMDMDQLNCELKQLVSEGKLSADE